jgi:hypothetical protein
MTVNLQPGMIGLTSISGDIGRMIRLGQLLNGNGFSRYEHAFVYLDAGDIIEAEPGGAMIRPLHHDGIHWCTGIARLLPPFTSKALADVAVQLEGVPYSWADYAALFTRRLHIPAPGLKTYIASSGHLICSQLADELYLRLGAHVFDDGRWPGYVTPGALHQRDLQLRKGMK